MRKRTEEFNIKELLNIFIPKLWIIVIAAMVCGMCMAVYSRFIKDVTYTCSTRIHVVKNSDMEFETNDVEFANTYLQTYVEVLNIPDFRTTVVERYKLNYSKLYAETYPNLTSEELYNTVIAEQKLIEAEEWHSALINQSFVISSSTNQDLLSVSVKSEYQELSYGIAQAIADVLVEGKTLAYDDAVKMRVVQQPKPLGRDSRNTVINTIIGGAVGAILSMVAIFIYNIADVTIRDKKKLEDNFDIPVLGVIPRFISDEVKVKNEQA